MRVYLDSCIVIYYVERHPHFFARIDERINDPKTHIAVSHLTRLECLVQPLRDDDATRLQRFQHFFQVSDLMIADLSSAVFDRAAALRARHRLKTPDALHLAAALEIGCDEFWTNDEYLKEASGAHLRCVAF